MGFKEKLALLAEQNKDRAGQLEEDRKTWIHEVNQLYKMIIDNWFKEYIEQGNINYIYFSLDTDRAECDDFITGTEIMELTLGGGPSVVLEPVGINVVGAFGKIKLYLLGHKDERVLLLLTLDGDKNFHWKLWRNNKQKDDILFNRGIFESLLNEWLEKWA